MLFKLTWRILSTVSVKCLWKILVNLCGKSIFNLRRFEKESRRGNKYFPAFTMISLTTRCNYSCQGCWVSTKKDTSLPVSTVQNIIDQSKEHGSYYFGLMGGETFLYEGLYDILSNNPDCYFQIFTNGSFLTKNAALKLKQMGNITPVISIEGLEAVSDERRRAKNVYASAIDALSNCVDAKLFTGVAASICQSNFEQLVNPEFLQGLIDMGACYVWYYIYRPVGSNPCPELALNKKQVLSLRRFLVESRIKFPIIIVDTYWDAQGRAVCPAAMGLSHHVSPGGYLEFCPPVQFSKDRLVDGTDFADKIVQSQFLSNLRSNVAHETRGCIFMEDPQLLHKWMTDANALDSTGRDTVYDEFSKMTPCVSHHITGEEIPEKSLFYRIIKKYWFFGFGAYG